MVRRSVILLVAVVALAVGLPVSGALAQTDPATAETDFVARINRLRAAKGLGVLSVHAELVDVARAWATEMAAADEISHNPALADRVRADWQKLGENVGVGMTVPRLHDAFVRSPAHYRNLVDPDFTHVGVAVVLGRDGAIFTTHQFMRLRMPKAAPPPPAAAAVAEAHVPVELAAAPVAVAAAPVPPQPSGRLVLVLERLRELDVQ
ncbi:MAG TPA: CAP domain-containing protein [Acidimicrobiales bacterium]|nr:CAP domain-containing protein [Acidimicrobiales bacterium]